MTLAPARLSTLLPLILGLLLLVLVLVNPAILNDGDTWWHVRAGQWMIEHRAVLHHDLFSYTLPGRPWSTHEWLSEVLMAGAFNIGGWSGIAGLTAVAAGLSALFLTRALSRNLSCLSLVLTAVVALSCVSPVLLARPHILALPCLILWTDALLTARARNVAPSLWWLPLMTLWANLHGGFFFGLALIGPFALEALLAAPGSLFERSKAVRGWIVFGLASLAAALLTPHGVDGLIFPFKLLSLSALSGVQEWKASDFTHLEPLEIAILTALAVCLGRGAKIPPVRLGVLLLLLHMALQHTRHQLLLGVVGGLVLAQPLAAALGQQAMAKARGPRWPVAAALGLAAVLIAARLMVPITRADGAASPIAALAAVPEQMRATPVLNEYGMGGYLIWNGVPVFVDGRTDFYGDAFMAGYYRATRPDKAALDVLMTRWNFGWTILSPGNPLVAVLDQRPGWRRVYADRYAVIHARN
jgi:hypothetical protein